MKLSVPLLFLFGYFVGLVYMIVDSVLFDDLVFATNTNWYYEFIYIFLAIIIIYALTQHFNNNYKLVKVNKK